MGVVIPPANAQDLAALSSARSLSFDAKTATSGGSSSQKTASGERTSRREQAPAIDLQVRNLARLPEHTHFDWFFIAKDTGQTGLYIWDRGEAELDVPGNGQAAKTIESRPLERRTTVNQHVQEYYYRSTSSGTIGVPYSTEKREGAVPHGWVVRMFVDGHLAKVQASSPELERFGRSPALTIPAPQR
jgi:hypothetical protein